jgi:hypothetical protein
VSEVPGEREESDGGGFTEMGDEGKVAWRTAALMMYGVVSSVKI